jgi:outer membrane protein
MIKGGIVRALLGVGAIALTGGPAAADTLREALVKAYQTNPTLTAGRAQVRALDESVPIARAAGLPAANGTGGYTQSIANTNTNTLTNPNRQFTTGVNVALPIYSGGSVRNSVAAANTRVEAGRADLRGTESGLFTAVVGAYMDVIRDEAVVSLNGQNVHKLEVNLQATRDRFQVGDLTRTDVAQSEARLAGARSQLEQAQAQLISSRENYIRYVGSAPGTLETPPALPKLPDSPDQAVQTALENNPSLLAAQKSRDATRFDVQVAKAGRLPQVSVVTGGSYYNYLDSLGAGTGVRPGQSGFGVTGGLQLNLPLFQGGRPAAQVRQAEALRSQAIEQVTDAERGVIAQTRSAYAMWRSAESVIASSESAVSANRLSLQGVQAENSVGSRTILDILNAEQELLNSEVTLVGARRDAYVAGFALLAAMGRAEARDLGLDGGVLYDPLSNYKRVNHRISDYGGDGEPQPMATSTAATPAQTATVTRPLDPEFDTPVDISAPAPSGSRPRVAKP